MATGSWSPAPIEVLVLLDAATSFRRFDDVSGDPQALVSERLAAARRKSWPAMLADHEAEHQRLFRRLSLDLGSSPAAALPTDARIAREDLAGDPSLATLYLQFGRYLMISSLAPGHAAGDAAGHLEQGNRPRPGAASTPPTSICR